MRQEHLDGLVAFVSVAQERGFSAAAVKLGVSPSAVSQAIRSLEQRLGAVLFNRTTRSVSLTELGERYLERIRPALEALSEATEELGHETDVPSGVLRLNLSRAAYLIVLQPLLSRFMQAYPDVNVEMRFENLLVDIVRDGFDAGIRFGELVEKDMVAMRVGPPICAHVIASPEYLARHGTPVHPRDLLDHDCIGFRHTTTGQVERWTFERDGDSVELAVKGRLVVNDSEVLVRAALDGLGVAYMINGYLDRFYDEGRLVRVLEEWSPDFPALHLYYPDRRRVPAKLRALIEFLRNPPATAQPAVDELVL